MIRNRCLFWLRIESLIGAKSLFVVFLFDMESLFGVESLFGTESFLGTEFLYRIFLSFALATSFDLPF